VEEPVGTNGGGRRRGPWTVAESAVVYENPWIRVRQDTARQAAGEETVFGVVEMKPGVSVLPLAADGRVHLVRVYRYTLDLDSLEVVSGGVDEGEPPEEAARRELREEAGIEASELVDLGAIDQLTEVVVSPNRMFLARGLSFGAPEREPSERIETVAVPLAEALRMVMAGEISHAASAVLLLKTGRLIGV
jgi:ADP-ribose pyrophosphatase